MGESMKHGAGQYWVLFYQPLPEAGERIALALVFQNGQIQVEYDPAFTKVSKLFPDADAAALAFSLDTLRQDLRSAESVQVVLNSYGPQFATSEPRRLALPVQPATIKMLKARYLYPAKRLRSKPEPEDKVSQEIAAFVRHAVDPNVEFRTNVGSREILGHSLPGTKRIAIAIPNDKGWTLVDGIDLNHLTVSEANKRTEDISRTFWHYKRAAAEAAIQIRRVGIVLNGQSHLSPKTLEAHDYALDRLRADSDRTIDAGATDSSTVLRELLANVTK